MVELPDPTDGRPDHQAEADSAGFSIAALVTELRDILGVRLVGYIGGTRSARIVSRWATGEQVPEREVEVRLRHTYDAAALLSQRYDATTVQSWFKGMNPSLADESPARVLGGGVRGFDSKDVAAAARSFVYIG